MVCFTEIFCNLSFQISRIVELYQPPLKNREFLKGERLQCGFAWRCCLYMFLEAVTSMIACPLKPIKKEGPKTTSYFLMQWNAAVIAATKWCYLHLNSIASKIYFTRDQSQKSQIFEDPNAHIKHGTRFIPDSIKNGL